MILSIGAFFILSLIIINMNKNILLTEEVMLDSNLGIQAISLGASIIEEAERKSFDNQTDTSGVSNKSSLTAASSFGPDAGEDANDHKTFNDFDDFHGYSIIDSSMAMTKFKITCTVEYADPDDPDKITTLKQWHKKIKVNVSSESMLDTVRLTTIFSYWAFL